MHLVEPKVYLLGFNQIWEPDFTAWLSNFGNESVEHFATKNGTISDPELLVEFAARRCYKSFAPLLNPNVKKIRKDSRDYMKNIIESGHGRVLEHANFTFAFEFVSRVFTHEIVRHAAGCTYAQESLRYVRLTDIGFWLPEEAQKNDALRSLLTATVSDLEERQRELATMFETVLGGDNFNAKKVLTSMFRRIAPEGLATGMVATFNARACRHIMELRSTQHAEEEMQLVIRQFGTILTSMFPLIFGDYELTANGFETKNRKV